MMFLYKQAQRQKNYAFAFSSLQSRIKQVGVIGAGQKGTGISILCNSTAGFRVKVFDISERALSKSRKFTEAFLEAEIEHQRLTKQDKFDVLHRFSYSLSLDDLRECDYVIESIIENAEVKQKLYERIDDIVNKDTVIASNTLAIPVSEIAGWTKRPEWVIGVNFFTLFPNNFSVVEVIKGVRTNQDAVDLSKAIGKALKKKVVEVNDYPGFLTNRVLLAYINEAIFALYERVASREEIDLALETSTAHAMGPLKLADFIGLDQCLYILKSLHKNYGDDKYRPCPLLVEYVNAGWLGKKTGRGFYEYKYAAIHL